MTAMKSKPASSAVRATVPRSAPRRAGPSGVVKSGICRPICTALTSGARTHGLAPYDLTPAVVQELQRSQEHFSVGGREHREDLLLPAPDPGLYGPAQPVAGRGQ